MYRIARERLRVIASQLDPEQFETLFSRVMSLVPPAELEEILGRSAAFRSQYASDEIGRLVSEGYKSWQKFDDKYRKNAENISSLNAGEAKWSDLGLFLRLFSNARIGPDSTVTSFEFHDDEIVGTDETLPTIVVDQKLYVCGDAGGFPIEPVNGNPVSQLGVTLSEIAERIKKAFLPEKIVGPGYFRLNTTLKFEHSSEFGLLFFLCQIVRQELGKIAEEQLERFTV